ncbi:uncharacterized protein DNG_01729 [Cephalotrichum gorgonifer]|uniref:Ubiquitination network signaling protein n=1 Tax=Cephalotrichum gorgonifer TaxID=2041049 RepID=A0AAE8MS46_9PEZI|nr:uncharacterized protein DNG_01729 [Cephalotrichum gorgonifer]
MPRGTASGKRQQPASTSHARHDNGLVAPGKKVSRSKNSGGHPDERSRAANSNSTTTTTITTTVAASSPQQLSAQSAAIGNANGTAAPLPYAANGYINGNINGYSKPHPSDDMGIDGRSHLPRRTSLGADSETSTSAESFQSHHQSHHQHYQSYSASALGANEPRQIDVNASKCSGDVHRDPGPLDYAATVLMSLPLHDTLAILLILMHVSPLTLSVIYTVFTVLTFASPLTAHSVVNVHLAELLDWHSTMPSLVTVLCVDVLALLVFLFLWPSVQNAILDLAKPVIAATLGGGSTSRGEDVSSLSGAVSAIRNPQPYFTILGLHILMQGVVRYIREWYIRRERISAASASHAGDPEAGKASTTSMDSGETSTQAPEVESLPSTHGTSAVSTKRRRKQSAQVRLQQPLWAALASTKVVMVKEYELSHATSEAASPGATDLHNLGNAPFDREGGKIWVSYVGCDEVSFDTSPFPDDFSDAEPLPSDDGASGTGVDRSKPFYVKVNNAHWLSTRIELTRDANGEVPTDVESSGYEGRGPQGTRWTGDIYGLRPMSKYVCQFVDSRTDDVLFTTTITTTREQTRSNSTAAVSPATTNDMPNGQRRPHSPITTLRTSIAAADAKLAAERTKLKTLRKEWKVKVNALKKENEGTDNSNNSAGGTDDRYRQKIRQQETQKAQAEKETLELADELRAFESTPTDVAERRKKTEEAWKAEKAVYEAAQKEFKSHSAAANSAVKSKEGEQQQLQTRRNKIASRVAKVDSELANITDANKRGLNEAERRRLERESWQRQVSGAEEKMNGDFNALQMENSILQDQYDTVMAQAKALHAQITYAAGFEQGRMPSPAQYPAAAVPTTLPPPAVPSMYGTPVWPGDTTSLPPVSAAVSAWGFPPPMLPSQLGQMQPPPGFKTRGRSSSMLSDVSGFTQLSGEEQQPQPFDAYRGRWTPGGGRSSGSGSARDPASPV